MKTSFTIRVYGIFIYRNRVLLAHETYDDRFMVKFPGGGMEFGEGTLDALRREMMEELDLELTSTEHYYTTDFFMASAFDAHKQVMSIYYKVTCEDPESIPTDTLMTHSRGTHSFHWHALAELKTEDLTFPIDRHVAGLLIREFNL